MDPWDAMRFGVAGLRLKEEENYLLSAREALRHFTMGSAEIMGWADKIGSLEVGKKADLIVIDIDQPHLSPLYDPVTVLVYNAGRRDVTHVMVDGKFTVEDGKLLWADHHELVADAQSVSERVWSRGGLAPLPS
jgi:5-methylthioadenosine/S-adenosylhomocysteine deaminase